MALKKDFSNDAREVKRSLTVDKRHLDVLPKNDKNTIFNLLFVEPSSEKKEEKTT